MGTAAGGTVLHWAAASGNKDMLAFLLERALDPNTQSYAGQTPLHVAAGRGHDACARLLLSDNAQPDLGAPSALRMSFPLVLQNYMSLRRWQSDFTASSSRIILSNGIVMKWTCAGTLRCMRRQAAGMSPPPGPCWLGELTPMLPATAGRRL